MVTGVVVVTAVVIGVVLATAVMAVMAGVVVVTCIVLVIAAVTGVVDVGVFVTRMVVTPASENTINTFCCSLITILLVSVV